MNAKVIIKELSTKQVITIFKKIAKENNMTVNDYRNMLELFYIKGYNKALEDIQGDICQRKMIK